MDTNRNANEFDPALFDDPAPARQRAGRMGLNPRANDRIAVGLGVLPRVVGTGLPIYKRTLSMFEADKRIESVYKPWHTTLQREFSSLLMDFGVAVLLDWHSMPSNPANSRKQTPNIVLGDRWGRSCDTRLTDLVAEAFRSQVLNVVYNDPYAGGYVTEIYGQPRRGFHVLQIEIDRSLYMSEERIEKSAGFAPLQRQITAVLAILQQKLPLLGLTPLLDSQAAE